MEKKRPKALVIGAAGQDGTYLRRVLDGLGWNVVSVVHKFSANVPNSHAVDLVDSITSREFLSSQSPKAIFHLAAKHGPSEGMRFDKSWRDDMLATHVVMTENLLRHISEVDENASLLVAGSSRVFGSAFEADLVADEDTEPNPQDFYGETKLIAWNVIKSFRDNYGANASYAILFNHESPLRKSGYLSATLADQVSSVVRGDRQRIKLRDVYARADWADARDVVDSMCQIMQLEFLGDFVLASGVARSVLELAKSALGKFSLENVEIVSEVQESFRPTVIGNISKANRYGIWNPKYDINDTLENMIRLRLSGVSQNLIY